MSEDPWLNLAALVLFLVYFLVLRFAPVIQFWIIDQVEGIAENRRKAPPHE